MIGYKVIREGIAEALMGRFSKQYPIDDEVAFHVNGPAFLVNLVDSVHILEDRRQVHRRLSFDVVYLAPYGTSTEAVRSSGMEIAMCFQPFVSFVERTIVVDEVSVSYVNEDVHVIFELDFYDDLGINETYEPMQTLQFVVKNM